MPTHFENPRSQRVADQIQRELALLLQREVKDPRIGMVTITAVSVSKELDHATVYFTVIAPHTAQGEAAHPDMQHLDDDSLAKQSLEGLQKAAGYLRRELSKRLKLRITPNLIFKHDKSMTEGNRLSSLIEAANLDTSPVGNGE